MTAVESWTSAPHVSAGTSVGPTARGDVHDRLARQPPTGIAGQNRAGAASPLRFASSFLDRRLQDFTEGPGVHAACTSEGLAICLPERTMTTNAALRRLPSATCASDG